MSNKQVIAIFVLGIALLLAVFWAGLNVVKQDTGSPRTAAPEAQAQNINAQKQAAPDARLRDQPSGGDTRYIVRVAAFGTLEQANQLTSELRRKYISAYTQMPAGQDTLFRVNIGPYDTRQAADQVANELAAQGRKGVMILPGTQN